MRQKKVKCKVSDFLKKFVPNSLPKKENDENANMYTLLITQTPPYSDTK